MTIYRNLYALHFAQHKFTDMGKLGFQEFQLSIFNNKRSIIKHCKVHFKYVRTTAANIVSAFPAGWQLTPVTLFRHLSALRCF